MAMIHEVRPLPGARKLMETLKERGHKVVLASSAKQDETLDGSRGDLEHVRSGDAWSSCGPRPAKSAAPGKA